MGLINMMALRQGLPRGRRLIGLDPGSKVVGVALSDVGLMLASAWGGMKRERLGVLAGRLTELARREEAGGFVVGYPLSMDGSEGPAAQAARDWAGALGELTGLGVALWDERLSSAAVNRMLVEEMDLSRRKRALVVDGMAAAYVLQAALDATREG